jgi:hypothetical protein
VYSKFEIFFLLKNTLYVRLDQEKRQLSNSLIIYLLFIFSEDKS